MQNKKLQQQNVDETSLLKQTNQACADKAKETTNDQQTELEWSCWGLAVPKCIVFISLQLTWRIVFREGVPGQEDLLENIRIWP